MSTDAPLVNPGGRPADAVAIIDEKAHEAIRAKVQSELAPWNNQLYPATCRTI